MEIEIIKSASTGHGNFLFIYDKNGQSGKSMIIYFGEAEICKTEKDAWKLAFEIEKILKK